MYSLTLRNKLKVKVVELESMDEEKELLHLQERLDGKFFFKDEITSSDKDDIQLGGLMHEADQDIDNENDHKDQVEEN